jgi:hypothetical protein
MEKFVIDRELPALGLQRRQALSAVRTSRLREPTSPSPSPGWRATAGAVGLGRYAIIADVCVKANRSPAVGSAGSVEVLGTVPVG